MIISLILIKRHSYMSITNISYSRGPRFKSRPRNIYVS